MIYMKCPFCTAEVGAFDHEVSKRFAKNWMGMHLAMYHRTEMIKAGYDTKVEKVAV